MDSMKPQPIVIGFSHYNTLGLLRSFGEAGYNPTLLLVCESSSDYKSFVTKCKYIGELHLTSEDKLVETLMNLNINSSKCMLFPSGDTVAEIVDKSYNELSTVFIVPNIAQSQDNLRKANHKENMRLCAERFGFKTPKSWIVKSISEDTIDNIYYPVIIKACHSQDASKNIQIFNTKEELTTAIDKMLRAAKEVQIQTFINKDKEIIYLGWACGEDVCIPCLMEKIREYPQKFGGTGFGYFSPDIDKYFDIEKLKGMIRTYKYTGLFSVEFIVCSNTLYFLEINFRNDGNGYFPGFGGVNLPVQLMSRCCGKISDTVNTEKKVSEPFYMMREYNDYKWRKQNGYPFLKWIKDINRTSVFQYWNRNDMLPFIFFVKEHVTNSVTTKFKGLIGQVHIGLRLNKKA